MNPISHLNIPVKLGVDGEWIVTELTHLTQEKCQCLLERALPLESNVQIMMLVSSLESGQKLTQKINCAGVVKFVECSPFDKKEMKYLVEIVFTAMSSAEKRLIAEIENKTNA